MVQVLDVPGFNRPSPIDVCAAARIAGFCEREIVDPAGVHPFDNQSGAFNTYF